MTTTNATIEFVNRFFTPKGGNIVERKAFKRFKKAMPESMDEETLERAFKAFTGKTPTYNLSLDYYSKYDLEQMQRKTIEMVMRLNSEPQSFSDLYDYRSCGIPMAAPTNKTHLIRKAFKQMAEEGIIGRITIKTRGQVAIYLYYAK